MTTARRLDLIARVASKIARLQIAMARLESAGYATHAHYATVERRHTNAVVCLSSLRRY